MGNLTPQHLGRSGNPGIKFFGLSTIGLENVFLEFEDN